MQDVVPAFRVSSGDLIFEDYRSKDGDEARIYTISIEMSNLFGALSPQNEKSGLCKVEMSAF